MEMLNKKGTFLFQQNKIGKKEIEENLGGLLT